MTNIKHQGSYWVLQFENILNFYGNLDDIFYWVCIMDDFLQTVSLKVVVSHALFRLTCDALNFLE